MPRFSFNKSSFLGGELSGRADGRSDLPQYNLGLKQCRNFVVLPSGGVTRRPGTIFVDDARGASVDSITSARCIPFVVSEDQSYIIILWNNSTSGFTEVRVINSDTLASQTVTMSATLNYQDLNAIQFAQSGDLMVLVADGAEAITIWRTSAGFFVDEYLDGLYPFAGNIWQRTPYIQNASAVTLTPSAVTGAITITSSAAYFSTLFVGSEFRFYSGVNEGYAIVTSYISPTQVNALVQDTLGSASATIDWAIGAFGKYRGFPRTVCLYNERLLFGGTEEYSNRFWASQVGDLFQFEPLGTTVSDAQSFDLASSRNNRIQWMDGGKKHSLGTIGSEWSGQFREDGTNLFVEYAEETAHGSAYIQPSKVSNAIQFIEMSRRKVREFVYNNDQGGYVSNDLTLLRDDVAQDSRIDGLSNASAPNPVMWSFSQDGYLYGITRDRGQQIAAWHSHQIGGKSSVLDPAAVISICATPEDGGRYDTLWMIVAREIGGVTKFYLERLDQYRYLDSLSFVGTDPDDWFYFTDSSKGVYSAGALNVFSGFSHLAGEEVAVMADGKYAGLVTVSGGGQITLPNSLTANRVTAGFPYNSRIKTMRQEGGSAVGSSVGSLRRPDRLYANMYKSRFFRAGFENPEARTRVALTGTSVVDQVDYHDQFCKEQAYVDPGEVMGDPYFTNSWIAPMALPAGYDDKAVAIILVDKPYPCTVLSLTTRIMESDI